MINDDDTITATKTLPRKNPLPDATLRKIYEARLAGASYGLIARDLQLPLHRVTNRLTGQGRSDLNRLLAALPSPVRRPVAVVTAEIRALSEITIYSKLTAHQSQQLRALQAELDDLTQPVNTPHHPPTVINTSWQPQNPGAMTDDEREYNKHLGALLWDSDVLTREDAITLLAERGIHPPAP